MKNVLSWVVSFVIFMTCFVGGIIGFKYAFQDGNGLLASALLFGAGCVCVKLVDYADSIIKK